MVSPKQHFWICLVHLHHSCNDHWFPSPVMDELDRSKVEETFEVLALEAPRWGGEHGRSSKHITQIMGIWWDMTHKMSQSVVPQESSWQSSRSLLQEFFWQKDTKSVLTDLPFSFFLKVLFLDLLAPVLHGKGCINMVPVWDRNWRQDIHIFWCVPKTWVKWLKDMFDGFFLVTWINGKWGERPVFFLHNGDFRDISDISGYIVDFMYNV